MVTEEPGSADQDTILQINNTAWLTYYTVQKHGPLWK